MTPRRARARVAPAPSTGLALGDSEQTSHVLTWDLDIDTNDTSVDLWLPLQSWLGEVILKVKVEDPQSLRITVDFGLCKVRGVKGPFSPQADLYWLDGSDEWSMGVQRYTSRPVFPSAMKLRYHFTQGDPATFGATNAAYPLSFNRNDHRRFRFTFAIHSPRPSSTGLTPKTLLPLELAELVAPSISTKRPNDIRFFFPRIKAELWANSSILIATSPYFKTMLESGVGAESIQRSGRKRLRSSVAPASGQDGMLVQTECESRGGNGKGKETNEAEVDDSDDETDDILASAGHFTQDDTADDGDFTYREIIITEAACSTYRAVLLYLVTSHISFAVLHSSLLPSNSDVATTWKQFIEAEMQEKPDAVLPLPVSAKSVYRLADLLEVPTLKSLALEHFKAQLCIQTVALELFSDASALYDELRSAALDFAVAQWSEVKDTEGMKQVMEKGSLGDWQGTASLVFELMARAAK